MFLFSVVIYFFYFWRPKSAARPDQFTNISISSAYAKKKSSLESSSYDNVIIIIGICCSSKFQDGTTRACEKYDLDRKDGIPYKLSV